MSAKPARAHAGWSVEVLRNFEPWFLSATSDFFAVHSGEITSRSRATRNLMRHRASRGPTVERLKFSARVAGLRCPERAIIGLLIGVSQSKTRHCGIQVLIRYAHRSFSPVCCRWT